MDINENMHESTQRKGKSVGNPFDDHSERMEVRVELKYEAINNYGALIYKDPLGRNVYKSAEHNTPFNESPKVVYQGDSYIGEDGARYVVTWDPFNVDSFGVLQPKPTMSESSGASSRKVPTNDATNKARPSNKPTGSGMSTNPYLEQIFSDLNFDSKGNEREDASFQSWIWTPIRELMVTRVPQDNSLQEVFRDSSDRYYAATKLPHLSLLVEHALTLEQSGSNTRIRDSFGSEF